MTRDIELPPPIERTVKGTADNIVEWWLDGRNLHTIEKDGKHYVYTDASIKSIERHYEGEGIKVQPLTLVLRDE